MPPSISKIVTVRGRPSSPVPVTVPFNVTSGSSGVGRPVISASTVTTGTAASTTSVSSALVLPAGSVWVAVNSTPSSRPGSISDDGMVQTPLPFPSSTTSTVKIRDGSSLVVTVTVAPISPVPDISVPSVGSMVGARGKSASTIASVGPLAFPAGSDCVAVSVTPSCKLAKTGSITHTPTPFPSSTTVAVKVRVGVSFDEIVTVAPISPVPVIASPLVASITGGGGGNVSIVMLIGSLWSLSLPAASVSLTVNACIPSATGSFGVSVPASAS